MPRPALRGGAGRYLLLYLALFLGWGVLSPFLPAVLAGQGATPEQIGLVLGSGIAARLLATPLAGALADRHAMPHGVLAGALIAAALLALGYGMATGFGLLLFVGVLHSAVTGPVGALPDALAVRAAAIPGLHVAYGMLRGLGSAAFIAGTALAGMAVGAAGGPGVVLWLHAASFLAAAAATLALPILSAPTPPPDGTRAALRPLLALPAFRRLLLATALIQGSHALYAGYATLHWQEAAIGPEAIGLLWALAVVGEVVVFLLLGRPLLARLGPGGLCTLAALAGLLRWSVMGLTAALPAMVLAQPLHGLTFAAQHLAAMAVIARVVPPELGASAQSLYAALGVGLSGAVMTAVSGALYGRLGAGAFWVMALLCLAALPAARALHSRGLE